MDNHNLLTPGSLPWLILMSHDSDGVIVQLSWVS